MTGSEFVVKCKKGISGGFFLYGDEDFVILKCKQAALKCVPDEGTEDFNYIKISAAKQGFLNLLEEAVMTLPVFSNKKLVELGGLKPSSLSDGDKEKLYEIFEGLADYPETVLIVEIDDPSFDAGKLPKAPSKLYKELTKYLEPIACERETPAKLAGWVAKRFASNRILCDSVSAHEMVEYCSADMSSLQNEVDKLSYYLISKGKDRVSYEDIRLVCSPGKIDVAFEFSNALMDGNMKNALSLVFSMQRRKDRPEVALGEIISLVTNMYTVKVLTDGGMDKDEVAKKTGLHQYRVGLFLTAANKRGVKRLAGLIEMCLDADEKIKSTPLDSYVVIEKLTIEVCKIKQ